MTRKRAVIPLIALLLVVSKSPVLAQQEKITAEEAKEHVCEEITVCGAVVWFETDRTRGTTLYLDEPYGKQVFTVVISDYNLEKLVELLQNSKGKQICARGVITEYNGAPQIQIQELGQIEVELESRLSNEAKAVRLLSTEVPQEEVALPDTIVLKRGTPIGLALMETLTPEETRITQGAFFEVFRDVRVRDLAVITRGAHAWGSVQMKKKANFGRPGSIRVELIAAHAITGDQVPLQASIAAYGEYAFKEYGAIFLPVFGWFVKGSDAEIPKGTKLCAYVDRDVSFDTELLRKFTEELDATKSIKLAAKRAANRGKSVVHVYRVSDEMGGRPRIYLDGQEVARLEQTRLITIRVEPGKHTFSTDKTEIDLDLQDSEEYYLRIYKQAGGWTSKAHLSAVTSDVGEYETYTFEPSKRKHVKERWHPDLATTLAEFAEHYVAKDKYRQAELSYLQALEIVESLEAKHPNAAQFLEDYAALLHKMNRDAEAEGLEARAQAIRAKHAQEIPQR